MKLLDYFFYKTYCFLLRIKKDESDTKWSAFLYTGFYFTTFIIIIVCVIGLLYDNSFSNLLKQNPYLFTITIGLMTGLALGIRYYRFTNVTMIETSYLATGGVKRIFIDSFLYVAPFAIPILTFILFRLYVVGHFKWW
ncbi:MAG TPA: hypothetical protein DIW31_11755 [Bacteroidales bacterium]|nr:hypothetical protein [Bacteroidales bacterium]